MARNDMSCKEYVCMYVRMYVCIFAYISVSMSTMHMARNDMSCKQYVCMYVCMFAYG